MARPLTAQLQTCVAHGLAVATLILAASCARPPAPSPTPPPPATADARIARVSLGRFAQVTVGATGPWQVVDRDGRVVARGDSARRIRLSAGAGGAMQLSQAGESDRVVTAAPVVASVTSGNVTVNGRRYRGTLRVASADTMVHVVNHVELEAYLRGVVPREIGVRRDSERAAVEAQAVAARSYALTRLGNGRREFDLASTTADQVYGGVDSENAIADAAIAATAGLVLYYGDRVISGQYYSTCGGSTAEASELWRSRDEPYLTRVSDRIGSTDRYYCDIAPRFRWDRSWSADTLATVIERYLRAYAKAPTHSLGPVRGVAVERNTASGRVATLRFDMDGGTYRV
ncbi:MAG TPA: SpoIID/LytB domain-containing protein, partial [Gemmatimonadaceae bacterium]|nr:SpoIID/LytB domain-containing protein [Gemmatimonadaceae bacterium]